MGALRLRVILDAQVIEMWRSRQPSRRQLAEHLYRTAVEQARRPVWYREFGVPDTPEGRFEMIALHVALVLRRLRREGVRGQALGQRLFDAMFVDLDGGLRELGVGDLSVGTYVKRLAGNFYARLAALDEGLACPAEPVAGCETEKAESLHPMLRANVYLGARPSDAQVAALACCMAAQDRALAAQDGVALCAGTIAWSDPSALLGTQGVRPV
jgi:cytochrome b pre-mRNA-processing protein 3